MLKIKPLKPSLREKKRYIVYQIDFPQMKEDKSLSMIENQNQLIRQINNLLGVFQSATAGILPIKVDEKTRKGILRVNHKAVDLVRSCFVMINKLGDNEAIIKTIGVSGILKKAQEKYFVELK